MTSALADIRPAPTPAAAPAGLSVTVLVPAHNEAPTIVRCLRTIQGSTYPLDRVVVAADACTDSTAALARACGAEVIETSYGDKAAAQNQVLPSITSDVVAGFDGDTFPEPDCIQLMVEAIAGGLDAVGATVLPAQPKGFFIRSRRFAYALGRRWWRWSQSQVGRVQVLTGACYAFRTDAIKGIGGFQVVPNKISSDMDTTWALHRAGKRVRYVGRAVALTMDPETFSQYHSQMQRWAAGYFQTMAKHKRALWHPKAMLVVGTAMFDLLTLPVSYGVLAWGMIHAHPWVRGYFLVMAARMAVNLVLVSTVVGPAEALLGLVPYTLINFYNKALYLWTCFREWILGRHYGSWTGRHGRAKVITPMTPSRRWTLATLLALTLTAAAFKWHPDPYVPQQAPAAPAPTVTLPAPTPNTIIGPDGKRSTEPALDGGP